MVEWFVDTFIDGQQAPRTEIIELVSSASLLDSFYLIVDGFGESIGFSAYEVIKNVFLPLHECSSHCVEPLVIWNVGNPTVKHLLCFFVGGAGKIDVTKCFFHHVCRI